jgi:hypothetical protein
MGGGSTGNRDALHLVGVALVLLAATLVFLSTFLPRLFSPAVDLQHNRLIENDEGVAFLISVPALISASIVSFRRLRAGWVVILVSLGILGLTIYSGTGPRVLVSSGVAGHQDDIYGQVDLGLASTGLGALLGMSGGLLIVSRRR